MREIEFRIKDCKGKWHYGFPVFFDDGSFTFFVNEKLNDLLPYEDCRVECAVNNTLGQYTGLCDKNGTKIFEGDIIKYFENNSGFEIKFNRIGYDSGVGLTGFVCVDDKRYCKEVDYDTKEEFYICDRCVDLKQVEVIGNVFDTAELLEE